MKPETCCYWMQITAVKDFVSRRTTSHVRGLCFVWTRQGTTRQAAPGMTGRIPHSSCLLLSVWATLFNFSHFLHETWLVLFRTVSSWLDGSLWLQLCVRTGLCSRLVGVLFLSCSLITEHPFTLYLHTVKAGCSKEGIFLQTLSLVFSQLSANQGRSAPNWSDYNYFIFQEPVIFHSSNSLFPFLPLLSSTLKLSKFSNLLK